MRFFPRKSYPTLTTTSDAPGRTQITLYSSFFFTSRLAYSIIRNKTQNVTIRHNKNYFLIGVQSQRKKKNQTGEKSNYEMCHQPRMVVSAIMEVTT